MAKAKASAIKNRYPAANRGHHLGPRYKIHVLYPKEHFMKSVFHAGADIQITLWSLNGGRLLLHCMTSNSAVQR